MIADAAWSDAILAVVSVLLGLRLLNRGDGPGTAGLGLLLVGIAAIFGTLRFSMAPSLALTHMGVTRLASMVGIPLVGVGWATVVWFPQHARQARLYAFVLLLVAAVALIGVEPYRTAVGALGMIVTLLAALFAVRREPVAGALGALGAIGVMVAGLVIGGEGSFGPLTRIAWFHLALTLANILLAAGLLRLTPGPGAWGRNGDACDRRRPRMTTRLRHRADAALATETGARVEVEVEVGRGRG